ncbi:MAG: LPS export ABC transporter periplasmic protein LptC [Spirochaetaceae bacterium]
MKTLIAGVAPAVVLAVSLVLGACSLDYEQIEMAGERDETVPETVVTDVRFTVVRTAARSFRITAARAETYPEREEQILHGLRFEELGADGEVITSGSADRAVHDTATDDVTMSGNITFYSKEYEARVTTDFLSWDNERKLLQGRHDESVRLELDSGSVVEGTGFEADMRRSIARFAESVRGALETDDE